MKPRVSEHNRCSTSHHPGSKTILNLIQHFTGFVYEDIRLGDPAAGRGRELHITLAAHAGISPRGSCCRQPAPGDDHLPMRPWLFVPVWGMVTCFFYAPRRVNCPTDGVVVEYLPWNAGKRPVTLAMMGFLARWARRLSWRETARVCQTSWENVYQSVEWFVQWGLAHRDLTGITALGVEDLHWGQGQGANRFLTVIYPLDGHGRRLLWVGRKRTEATLCEGLVVLGTQVVGGVRYVSSDLWRPYLNVIAAQIRQALHVLDRFHITLHLNQAVDQMRRAEFTRLRAAAPAKADPLKKMRWKLLRRGSRVRGRAKMQLQALLRSKLATPRAWMLKDTFQHFCDYKSVP